MVADLTFIDADDGVDLIWRRLGTRQAHRFPAHAVGQLGVVRLKQTLKRKHRYPLRQRSQETQSAATCPRGRSVNGVPKQEPHKRQRNDDSEYDQEVEVHSAAYRGTPGICAGSHRGTASGTGDRGDEQSRSPSLNTQRPGRQQFDSKFNVIGFGYRRDYVAHLAETSSI
jgi:hypothetical protein